MTTSYYFNRVSSLIGNAYPSVLFGYMATAQQWVILWKNIALLMLLLNQKIYLKPQYVYVFWQFTTPHASMLPPCVIHYEKLRRHYITMWCTAWFASLHKHDANDVTPLLKRNSLQRPWFGPIQLILNLINIGILKPGTVIEGSAFQNSSVYCNPSIYRQANITFYFLSLTW